MVRAWGLAGAYAGAIIGAGFASGQELLHFFGAFGTLGLWGVGAAGLLFTLIGGMLFEVARSLESESHQTLILRLCGAYVGPIIDAVLNIFLFASLGVMLAAAGALFAEQLGTSFTIGVLLTAFLTGAIGRGEPARLLRWNGVLVTALVVLTLVVLIPVLRQMPFPVTAGGILPVLTPQNWVMGALLYSSFNLVLALSPLSALGRELTTTAQAFLGAALGSAVLVLTGSVMLVAMLQNAALVVGTELPLLALVGRSLPRGALVYVVVVYLALLTSCVAVTYGLGHRAASGNLARARQVAGWLPLSAVPLAYLGFGNLVHSLYPLIGYAGIGLLIVALVRRLLMKY